MARRPLLLGHRGLRGFPGVKENTIEAFDLAMQHGCDGFEFDVRLTRDGEAVVCHDPTFAGVTLSRASASQLEPLSQLKNVLQRFHGAAFLNIELKVAGLEDGVAKLLQEFPPERGYVVSSFLPEVVKKLDSWLQRGIICETKGQLRNWQLLEVQYVILHWKLLSEKLAGQIHESGAKILAWTVNDAEGMRNLAKWGVDGIISDHPKLLVKTLGSS